MPNNVCFLIDDAILRHHHGVRRLLFSMARGVESAGGTSRFVVRNHQTGRLRGLTVSSAYMRDNGFDSNALVGESRAEILARLGRSSWQDSVARSATKNATPGLEFAPYREEPADLCVFGGPWVYRAGMTLPPAERHVCVACDAIPNRYYFANPDDRGLWFFAYEHSVGFQWADHEADGLFCISERSAEQLARFGFGREKGLSVLPAMLPPGFEDEPPGGVGRTRDCRTAILAAPFDLRKGLERMPVLLNAGGFENLKIFGRPRCAPEAVRAFFETVEIERIEWWLDVDFERQRRLYASAGVLLFPSLSEGLGLPVLEAYASGASVLVSDIAPLNALAMPEDVLPRDPRDAARAVAARAGSEICPGRYREFARERWGANRVVDVLRGETICL